MRMGTDYYFTFRFPNYCRTDHIPGVKMQSTKTAADYPVTEGISCNFTVFTVNWT